MSSPLLNPVFLIAMVILIGTFALIGAAIIGKDSGVLARMSDSTFARGLITYLFTVVTVGTAVVLVVYSLSGAVASDDKQFERGKDVLSLLLGVFGTIVGFYFGSELKDKTQGQDQQLHLTSPLFTGEQAVSGGTMTIAAHVRGGTPPYRFGAAVGDDGDINYSGAVRPDGWIQSAINLPKVDRDSTAIMRLAVKDALGRIAATSQELRVAANK